MAVVATKPVAAHRHLFEPVTTTKGSTVDKRPHTKTQTRNAAAIHLPTTLDWTEKQLNELPSRYLHEGLEILKITGYGLEFLPNDLLQLGALEQLYAGANRLSHADMVFHCRRLVHAGLSYNRISSLPTANTSSALMSLDLAHNDLCAFSATVELLQQLPSLRSLELQGNPFCILPGYQAAARAALPQLSYFDGQKLDPSVAALAAPPSAGGAATHSATASTPRANPARQLPASTRVLLELEGLKLLMEPGALWAPLVKQAAALATEQRPAPALRPILLHLELSTADGDLVASLPLQLLPPHQEPDALEGVGRMPSKLGGPTKAATPAAKGAKAGTPKVGKILEEGLSTPSAFLTGRCRFAAELQPTVAARDWLRNGVKLTLFQTHQEVSLAPPRPNTPPAPDPPAPEVAEPGASDKKGKGTDSRPGSKSGSRPSSRGGKEAKPPAKAKLVVQDPAELAAELAAAYQYKTITTELATAQLPTAVLVTGSTAHSSGLAKFIPVRRLFDERGVRMGLDDPRHDEQPMAGALAKVQLHAPA